MTEEQYLSLKVKKDKTPTEWQLLYSTDALRSISNLLLEHDQQGLSNEQALLSIAKRLGYYDEQSALLGFTASLTQSEKVDALAFLNQMRTDDADLVIEVAEKLKTRRDAIQSLLELVNATDSKK